MNLSECYKILELPQTASDDEIKKSFKVLALKYHPDRNQDRVEWANDTMANLNLAYTSLMQLRFRDGKSENNKQGIKPQETYKEKQAQSKKEKTKTKNSYYNPYDHVPVFLDHDTLTKEFVKIRESTNNELYRYFQYGIYNITRRENILNKTIFNDVTSILKQNFHSIAAIKKRTNDPDFVKHFDVFSVLIYNFYMASECNNVTDSYSNAIDIKAYSSFKKGDDMLQPFEKELFFDRHNRGFFRKKDAESLLLKSELNFKNTLAVFPNSTWAIETKIKLQYTLALKEYFYLFFSDYKEKV